MTDKEEASKEPEKEPLDDEALEKYERLLLYFYEN